MLTGRAVAVLGGGALLWLASRLVGSADLHIVAVGLLALVPLAAALVRWSPRDLRATRRLSTPRAFPGSRVRVDLDLENAARTRTSFVLLEDRLPSSLGPPARAVVGSLAPGGRERVSYHVTCQARGRYAIGPLSASLSDPFGLVRQRVSFSDRQELIVYPEIEELDRARVAAPVSGAGESTTRQLFRSGEEFYTMRAYETGDDLRKIHWPSVARTGELMIRQDETARRAAAAVFLDTRRSGAGATSEGFERAVSATASIGELYLRLGYGLRFATPDRRPEPVDRGTFLEALALVEPSRADALTPALERLRDVAGGGSSVLVITHLLAPPEIAALTRVGSAFGPKLAVLVYPRDLDPMSLRERTAVEDRAGAARISLLRGGWDVVLVTPSGRLADGWRREQERPRIAAFS